MKGKMHLYYDEEGDFLEINLDNYKNEGFFRNLGKGIFERIDKKTNKVVGIAIMGFKKRTQDLKDVEVNLPIQLIS